MSNRFVETNLFLEEIQVSPTVHAETPCQDPHPCFVISHLGCVEASTLLPLQSAALYNLGPPAHPYPSLITKVGISDGGIFSVEILSSQMN